MPGIFNKRSGVAWIAAGAQLGSAQGVGVTSLGDPGFGISRDGSDMTSKIQTLLNQLSAAGGGGVYAPGGVYGISAPLIVPGGVTLFGDSIDYAITSVAAGAGAVFKALGAIDSVIHLGLAATPVYPTDYVAGKTSAQAAGIVVDAMNLATSAIRIEGPRANVTRCQAWRGATYGIRQQGQNGYIRDSVVGMDDRGICVSMEGNDNKLYDTQLRGGTTARVKIAAQNCEMKRNHAFPNQTSQTGNDVIVQGSTADTSATYKGTVITDNVFGTDQLSVPHIVLSGALRDTTILGNHAYLDSLNGSSIAVPFVYCDGTQDQRGLLVSQNNVHGQVVGTYSAIIQKAGTGTLYASAVNGNVGYECAAIYTGFTPDVHTGNVVRANGVTTVG